MRTPLALLLLLALGSSSSAIPPPPGPAERARAAAEKAEARAAGVDLATFRARRDLRKLRDRIGSARLTEHREALAARLARAEDYLRGMQRSEISDTLTNAQRYGMLAGALRKLLEERGLLVRWALDRPGLIEGLLPGAGPQP